MEHWTLSCRVGELTLLCNSQALHAQAPGSGLGTGSTMKLLMNVGECSRSSGLGTGSTMELLMNVGECSRSKHMLHPPSFIEKSLAQS